MVALLIVTTWIAVRLNNARETAAAATGAPVSADTGVAHTGAAEKDPTCCGDGKSDDGLSDVAGLFGAEGAASMPGGGKPLKGVPADLPLYNGAQLLLGYEQTADGWVQQMGVWTIPDATVDQVSLYYRQAAERGGFKADAATSNPTTNHVFRRDGQALLVRVRQAGRAVRLSLIFRYTM